MLWESWCRHVTHLSGRLSCWAKRERTGTGALPAKHVQARAWAASRSDRTHRIQRFHPARHKAARPAAMRGPVPPPTPWRTTGFDSTPRLTPCFGGVRPGAPLHLPGKAPGGRRAAWAGSVRARLHIVRSFIAIRVGREGVNVPVRGAPATGLRIRSAPRARGQGRSAAMCGRHWPLAAKRPLL
jgi:hypothetical protein